MPWSRGKEEGALVVLTVTKTVLVYNKQRDNPCNTEKLFLLYMF